MWLMYPAQDSWLGVMCFVHVTPLGHIIGLVGFDWLGDMGQLSRTSHLMDFSL